MTCPIPQGGQLLYDLFYFWDTALMTLFSGNTPQQVSRRCIWLAMTSYMFDSPLCI